MSKKRKPTHMIIELYAKYNNWLFDWDEGDYQEALGIIKRQLKAELGWDVWAEIVFPEQIPEDQG